VPSPSLQWLDVWLWGWRSSAKSNWRVIAVASYSLLTQAIGCTLLAFADGHNILDVLSFGLGVGNAISIPSVIANFEFSESRASRAVALIVAISQGAYALVPALSGLLRQAFSNQSIFEVALLVQLLAIIAYLQGDKTSIK
jgi:predicted MFS family arabinose efflux permease